MMGEREREKQTDRQRQREIGREKQEIYMKNERQRKRMIDRERLAWGMRDWHRERQSERDCYADNTQ